MKHIKTIVYVLIAFLLGLMLAITIIHNKNKELINNQYIELDNSREVIDKLTQENERLKTILNNYTIDERKGDNSHEQ